MLITNDDGIFAEGIYKLAVKLNEEYEVYVVAPDRQRSATGHAITMHHPLRANKVSLFDTNIEAWAVDGTPADCVKLAVEALLEKTPDLIISGINDGPNLGTDVLYSGTVSAAIEGAIHGIQSIAVSMAESRDINYNLAVNYISKLLLNLKDKELPFDTLLNINVPNTNFIKGVKITTLGIRRYKNSFIKRNDPRGKDYYWLGGEIIEEKQSSDSDVVAVNNGYISITPIHYDLTKYNFIEELKNWDL